MIIQKMNPGTPAFPDSLIKSICKGWISCFLDPCFVFRGYISRIPDRLSCIYERSFLAISEILFPSDFPAKAFEAAPITFPKSLADSAPV